MESVGLHAVVTVARLVIRGRVGRLEVWLGASAGDMPHRLVSFGASKLAEPQIRLLCSSACFVGLSCSSMRQARRARARVFVRACAYLCTHERVNVRACLPAKSRLISVPCRARHPSLGCGHP